MLLDLRNDKDLSTIVGKLRGHFNPLKIYLFGSRSNGNASINSDYDLFLIVKSSDKKPIQRMQEAKRLFWGQSIAVDIFIYTEEEFNDWKNEFSSIAYIVATEGVELDFV